VLFSTKKIKKAQRMKIKTIQKRLLSGLIGVLTFGVAAPAYAGPYSNDGCTLRSFKGTYAYEESGTIAGGIGKDVEVGVLISDGKGFAEGHGTMNVETLGVLHAEFTDGTYTLDSDCTGIATFIATLTTTEDNLIELPAGIEISSGPRSLAFAVQRGGTIVFIGLTPGDSLSGSAKRTPVH